MFNLFKTPFVLEDGNYGKLLKLREPWDEATEKFIIKHQIPELVINPRVVGSIKDISFIERLPHLKAIRIYGSLIHDISSIKQLHNLRRLSIGSYSKDAIDFSNFPFLEDCRISWQQNRDSIFDCVTLKKLILRHYSKKDTNRFSGLQNLESLCIYSSPIEDLTGIGTFKKLKFLGLYHLTKLKSLKGIETLENLETLDIETCKKISSINEVASLKNLQKLKLNNCGDIESIKPLSALGHLNDFSFYESTNILDGDLSVWDKFLVKQLERPRFKERKHYNRTREDFK